MNKKRNIFIMLKIIFIIFLTYIHMASDLNKDMVEVFGFVKNLFVPYIIISIFSDLVVEEKKRMVLKTRIFFSVFFLVAIANLQFLYVVEGFSEKNLEKKVFMELFIKENLGMLITMIYYNLYFAISHNTNMIITGIILFFSSFVLFGKIIGNIVREISRYYSLENRRKRKEIKRLRLERSMIKKQIQEKEKTEEQLRVKRKKLEHEKDKKIKQKIHKMKKTLEEEKEIKTGSGRQLNLEGVNSVIPKNIFEINEKQEEKIEEKQGKEESKNQLEIDFEKVEVKNDDTSF